MLLASISILFAASQLNTLRAEFYFTRGARWFFESRQGPPEAAEHDLVKAKHLNPANYRYPYVLGMFYLWQGRSGEAFTENSGVLKLHPHYPNGWNNLGVALARMGRLEEARQAFNKALALIPDYNEPKLNLIAITVMITRHVITRHGLP